MWDPASRRDFPTILIEEEIGVHEQNFFVSQIYPNSDIGIKQTLEIF